MIATASSVDENCSIELRDFEDERGVWRHTEFWMDTVSMLLFRTGLMATQQRPFTECQSVST